LQILEPLGGHFYQDMGKVLEQQIQEGKQYRVVPHFTAALPGGKGVLKGSLAQKISGMERFRCWIPAFKGTTG
jgi:hypothetical protein